MPRQLKQLKFDEISSVLAGDDPHAKVLLRKESDMTKARGTARKSSITKSATATAEDDTSTDDNEQLTLEGLDEDVLTYISDLEAERDAALTAAEAAKTPAKAAQDDEPGDDDGDDADDDADDSDDNSSDDNGRGAEDITKSLGLTPEQSAYFTKALDAVSKTAEDAKAEVRKERAKRVHAELVDVSKSTYPNAAIDHGQAARLMIAVRKDAELSAFVKSMLTSLDEFTAMGADPVGGDSTFAKTVGGEDGKSLTEQIADIKKASPDLDDASALEMLIAQNPELAY